MELPERIPIKRAGHRWMSIYDASSRFLELKNPLFVFYSAFLTVDEKKDNQKDLFDLLKHLKKDARTKVIVILQRLKNKKLTKAGRERKRRILNKLYKERNHSLLLANVIISVLPIFKSFILTFEQKEPMIHRLFDEIVLVFKTFLTCFLTHEYVNTFKNISKVNVRSDNVHPLKQVFIGDAAQKILKEKMDHEERKNFRATALTAFIETAGYLQHKLPINNKTLALLSTLDPVLCGHSRASSGLQELFDSFPTFTQQTDKDKFSTSASTLQSDTKFTESITEKKLDRWWGVVISNPNYKILSPVIKASLSIFTGPRVESSFSIMNNIITTTTNRLDVGTYEAIHKVKFKYKLLNEMKSSVTLYHREDPVFSPVDTSLCYHMQTAGSRMKNQNQNVQKKFRRSKIVKKHTVHEDAQNTRLAIDQIEYQKKRSHEEIEQQPPTPSKRVCSDIRSYMMH